MGGITCNAEGFAGETGAVDVLEGGERDTNDLLSCSHYPLKGLAAGRVAGAIPHSDAASQDEANETRSETHKMYKWPCPFLVKNKVNKIITSHTLQHGSNTLGYNMCADCAMMKPSDSCKLAPTLIKHK